MPDKDEKLMVWIKICGITNIADAQAAVEQGADAIGFVFAPSPRQVTPERAKAIIDGLNPRPLIVGVFVNEDCQKMMQIRDACSLDLLQLHGTEREETVSALGTGIVKTIRMNGPWTEWRNLYPGITLLLDTYVPTMYGGTGKSFDWLWAVDAARQRRIILAGGLTPENAAEAVRRVQPFGIDVSSGVEKEPGRKDHEKLAHFIRSAKAVGECAGCSRPIWDLRRSVRS